jgi:hypothetical protein
MTILPNLIERMGKKRLQKISDILLVIPIVVILIVAVFYFVLWKADLFIHFTHMIWVLGFWMVSTLGMFIFVILKRLKISSQYFILIIASVALAIAIYFTPLSRFTRVFSNPSDLVLPAVIGVMNIMICWLFVTLFRNRLSTS